MATSVDKTPELTEKPIDQPPEYVVTDPDNKPSNTIAISFDWLTVEVALYIVIFVIAIGLRLWRAGVYPLSNIEATQSLVALGLVRGETLIDPSYFSPLLVTLNSISFFLFGSSDAIARLASALLGTTLVVIPMTLRRQLGSYTCLIASALLAISPALLYLSRTVNSEIAVVTGALLIITGFLNWSETGRERWLIIGSIGVAILLAAGTMTFAMLIIFGLIAVIGWSTFRLRWNNGVRQSVVPDAPPDSLIPETTLDQSEQSRLYTFANPLKAQTDSETEDIPLERLTLRQLQNAGLILVVLLVFFTTTGLFNLSGFSMITGSLNDWVGRFSFEPRSDAGFNAIFLLTLYEPLIIVSGLIGLTLVIMRGHFVGAIFAGWFLFGLMLDLPLGGRPTSSIALPLVPLIFLAAIAFAELWRDLQDFGQWANEGLLLGAGLTFAGFGYIGLTSWVDRTCGVEDTLCQYLWLQALAALGLFIAVAVLFGVLTDVGVTIRGLAITGTVIGLLFLINSGWRLNYGPFMHHYFQPLAGFPASTELVALTDTLTTQSVRRGTDRNLLDVTITGVDSPALHWRLQDFHNLQESSQTIPSTVVITPINTELATEAVYVGQDFALDTLWSPVGLSTKALIEWFIYGFIENPNPPPQSNQAILWLQLGEQ